MWTRISPILTTMLFVGAIFAFSACVDYGPGYGYGPGPGHAPAPVYAEGYGRSVGVGDYDEHHAWHDRDWWVSHDRGWVESHHYGSSITTKTIMIIIEEGPRRYRQLIGIGSAAWRAGLHKLRSFVRRGVTKKQVP